MRLLEIVDTKLTENPNATLTAIKNKLQSDLIDTLKKQVDKQLIWCYNSSMNTNLGQLL